MLVFRAASISKHFLPCNHPAIRTWKGMPNTQLDSSRHVNRLKCQPMARVNCKRPFHTSNRNQVPPILVVLLKNGGIKLLKALSIIFARSFRILHSKLPESVRLRVGRHKIFFSTFSVTTPLVAYYSYTHYDTCPITGRKRWITFTREQVLALSDLDYDEIMRQYTGKFLDESHPIYQKNLELVLQLVNGNLDIDFVKNTKWNLHVIDDPSVTNACVLPNGHIFVFGGMLKMLNTWEEMSVILGHEMSHAILGHSQEQQSYLAFGELITIPLLAFIWFFFEDFAAFIVYSIQQYIFPIIFKYGFSLPYSRKLESEADEVGMMLAAKACFDPRWSLLLWEKMAMKDLLEGGGSGDEFEFLSTHPSNQKRSVMLERKLPEVLEKRTQCNCPPLPSNINPKAAAHEMRKCVSNVRERKALMDELNHNVRLLEESERTEMNASKKEDFQKLKEVTEDIKRKLHKLEEEYQQLVSSLQSTEMQNAKNETEEKTKEKSSANMWTKVIGTMSTTGRLSDTLFDKEKSKLHAMKSEKSDCNKN